MISYIYLEDDQDRLNLVAAATPAGRHFTYSERVTPRTLPRAREAVASSRDRLAMILDLSMPALDGFLPQEWRLAHERLGSDWENGIGFVIDALKNSQLSECLVFVASSAAAEVAQVVEDLAMAVQTVRCVVIAGFAPVQPRAAEKCVNAFFSSCDSLWKRSETLKTAIRSILAPLSRNQFAWEHDRIVEFSVPWPTSKGGDFSALLGLRNWLGEVPLDEGVVHVNDIKALFMTQQGSWYKGGTSLPDSPRPLRGATLRAVLTRLGVTQAEMPSRVCLPTVPGLPFLLSLSEFIQSLDHPASARLRFSSRAVHDWALVIDGVDGENLMARHKEKEVAGNLTQTSLGWDRLKRCALAEEVVRGAVSDIPNVGSLTGLLTGGHSDGLHVLKDQPFRVLSSERSLELQWSEK